MTPSIISCKYENRQRLQFTTKFAKTQTKSQKQHWATLPVCADTVKAKQSTAEYGRRLCLYCPSNKLTFDLLTLKVLSNSRVTWATSVPILVFLNWHRGSPRHTWLGQHFQGQKVKGQLVAYVLNSQHARIGATWRINVKILSTCRGWTEGILCRHMHSLL